MSKLTIEVEDNDGSALIRILVDGKPVGIMTEFKLFADASASVIVNATFADTPESLVCARELAKLPYVAVYVDVSNRTTLALGVEIASCNSCEKETDSCT